MARILVTGATGFVGGRLVRPLLDAGHQVRVMVRDERKAQQHPWSSDVEIVVGQATDAADLRSALSGIDVAYYLLHSMSGTRAFEAADVQMAEAFATAAEAAGVKQIVYVGGISNDSRRSRHLRSRVETGAVLASHATPVIELRCGIIIGAGSASFEMLRHLTQRLPIMTTPRWVSNRTQPIAIRDVLHYLTECASLPEPVSGVFDVGGPEVVTYEQMMQAFAQVAGLRRRVIIKVPVLTPGLSSLWVGLVTPLPSSLARPLVESLISEVVVDSTKSITNVLPLPPDGLLTVRESIERALQRVSDNSIETRWTDAAQPTAPWQRAQGDPQWVGDSEYTDVRRYSTSASVDEVWKCVESIGGDTGWYGADWLWYLRGLADRFVGGVGLRRGRRDPLHLRIGDSLDFWRVQDLKVGESLRLYAEMVLPGKAWLEFHVSTNGELTTLTQTATFRPRGLGGHLYWRLVAPFHGLIFPTMVRNICRRAELASDVTSH